MSRPSHQESGRGPEAAGPCGSDAAVSDLRPGSWGCMDAALWYRSLGLRPIPLNGKVPTLRAWQKAPMPDEREVRRWFDLHPDANVGLPALPGTIVLDVDTLESHAVDGLQALRDLEATHGPLPPTWTGVTGSGGLHLWLRAPEDLGNGRGSLPEGIDVRGGSKGQVVVWPSIHPETGRQYTWQEGRGPDQVALADAPEWLVELIRRKPVQYAPVPRRAPGTADRSSRYAQAALQAEVEAVASAPEGQRNNTLNRAALALGGLVAGGELSEATVRAMLTGAAFQCGLEPTEIAATITSGLKAGMTRPREVPRQDRPPPRPEPPAPSEPPPELEGEVFVPEPRPERPEPPPAEPPWGDFLPFQRDSDPCLSERLVEDLQRMHGGHEVLYDEGAFYAYDASAGIWRALDPDAVWRVVSGYDGRPVLDGRSKGRCRPLSLKASRIAGAIKDAEKRAGRRGFFGESSAVSRRGIAFANGFVVVDSSNLRVEPFSPEHRCRATLPVPFDPGASCPRWERFLLETLTEDPDRDQTIQMLQEFVGACLLGVAPAYERCLVLYGYGANGKSQFLVVFNSLFPPELRCAIAPQQFEREFKLAALAGKLINVVSEMPDADVAASERFKGIVSGEPITAEHKHRDPFTFQPRAGHLFACNALPGTPDASDGYWRRFLLVPLERTLRDEDQVKNLGASIAAEELPGIAVWGLLGAMRLLKNGMYTVSKHSQDAHKAWRLSSDIVGRWVEERTVRSEHGGTAPRALYNDFRDWAIGGGHKPLSENKFFPRLARLHPQKRGTDCRFYPLHLVGSHQGEFLPTRATGAVQ